MLVIIFKTSNTKPKTMFTPNWHKQKTCMVNFNNLNMKKYLNPKLKIVYIQPTSLYSGFITCFFLQPNNMKPVKDSHILWLNVALNSVRIVCLFRDRAILVQSKGLSNLVSIKIKLGLIIFVEQWTALSCFPSQRTMEFLCSVRGIQRKIYIV